MSKIFYFDCETTGVDHKVNGIIQLAFVLEIDGEIVEEQDIRMRPFNRDIIEPLALEVNKITMEQIQTFEHPLIAYEQILQIFNKHIDKFNKDDKFFPAGFNVRFDIDFFSEFWKKASKDKYGLGSYCNWRSIDPLPVIYFLVENGILSLENYKLSTVCEYFGITLDDAHDALADIKATIELIRIVKKEFINYMLPTKTIIKNSIKEN